MRAARPERVVRLFALILCVYSATAHGAHPQCVNVCCISRGCETICVPYSAMPFLANHALTLQIDQLRRRTSLSFFHSLMPPGTAAIEDNQTNTYTDAHFSVSSNEPSGLGWFFPYTNTSICAQACTGWEEKAMDRFMKNRQLQPALEVQRFNNQRRKDGIYQEPRLDNTTVKYSNTL